VRRNFENEIFVKRFGQRKNEKVSERETVV
jgi:hypothetical protein